MDKNEARKIIEDLFDNKFDIQSFINFSRVFLYSAKFKGFKIEGDKLPESYKEHIISLNKLASYSDSNENEIDLLVVTLKKDTSLDKARTMQRNFVARHLRDNDKDAALVAFINPDSSSWRFSLIKMDLNIDGMKVKESYSPAKRWSFLVGEEEGSHTAKTQLLNFSTSTDKAPTLSQLEQVFNIEVITKEFFENYRELYFQMKGELDELVESDKKLKSDFKAKNVDTSDFAKKTIGQIAFLYFLQKKGWFGVKYQEEWGTGLKNFLRQLFSRRKKYGVNFFNDVLEPLFYEALAIDRGEDSIYTNLNNVRIPFLNGGLFEPMNGYNWEHTNILLPDELFSNTNETREGDIGNGILDIFDRYNFTVNESDPLDKEVAVDPEMLGKVFENLLEVKERKDKGTYYTPREIVNYMCQESLINFLLTETDGLVPKEDLKVLIQEGLKGTQNDKYFFSKDSQNGEILPQSCIDWSEELDNALANIKVCDPAVGSGAFTLGMLNTIVAARKLLSIYLEKNRSTYSLKFHAISKSLYGVDIDPGAIEIAKLRLWLSLVVEEDTPSPLPNLEHKIMQGNSLISQFEGIELFDDELLNSNDALNSQRIEIENKLRTIQKNIVILQKSGALETKNKNEIKKEAERLSRRLKDLRQEDISINQSLSLFDESTPKALAQEKSASLQSKVAQYVSIESKGKKEALKQEIEDLKWDLIEITLKEKGEVEKLLLIKEQRKNRVKPFFIWRLEFGEVFNEKKGFDIVIGNPPYQRIQNIDKNVSSLYKKLYSSATGSYDLYVLFAERGLDLISNKGIVNYIMPNKWTNSAFGKGLRDFSKTYVKKLISFQEYQVFNASTYTSLVWFDKSKKSELNFIGLEEDLNSNNELDRYLINLSDDDFTKIRNVELSSSMWILTNKQVKSILEKLNSQPLRMKDIFKKIFTGLQTSKDSIYFLSDIVEKDDLIIEGYSKELNKRILIERGLVKKLLKGDDVHRYETLATNKVVIFPYYFSQKNNDKKAILFSEEELKNKFPNGYIYLKECEDILRDREKGKLRNDDQWFRYIYPKNLVMFDEKKLIQPDISHGGNFAFDSNGDFYCTTTLYGYVKHEKIRESYTFLMALLNSKVCWFFLQKTGTVLANGYFRFMPRYIDSFPIPNLIHNESISVIEELAEKIIEKKRLDIDSKDLEHRIDKLIYELYELTTEEIKIIESNCL